jgi:thioredoxin 1
VSRLLNFHKLVKKYPDARFYSYDTEQADDIAQELGVNLLPTFHVFRDGDVMQTVTGAKGAALEKAIKENYQGKIEE